MHAAIFRRTLTLFLVTWMALVDVSASLAQAATFTRELSLAHGAFHPREVPNVIVHGKIPAADAALHLVVFLHGFSGCAKALVKNESTLCGSKLVAGQDLAAQLDAAGTDALLIVPQLALLKRNGSPGDFGKPGGFAAFLRELLDTALVEQLGKSELPHEKWGSSVCRQPAAASH